MTSKPADFISHSSPINFVNEVGNQNFSWRIHVKSYNFVAGCHGQVIAILDELFEHDSS